VSPTPRVLFWLEAGLFVLCAVLAIVTLFIKSKLETHIARQTAHSAGKAS